MDVGYHQGNSLKLVQNPKTYRIYSCFVMSYFIKVLFYKGLIL